MSSNPQPKSQQNPEVAKKLRCPKQSQTPRRPQKASEPLDVGPWYSQMEQRAVWMTYAAWIPHSQLLYVLSSSQFYCWKHSRHNIFAKWHKEWQANNPCSLRCIPLIRLLTMGQDLRPTLSSASFEAKQRYSTILWMSDFTLWRSYLQHKGYSDILATGAHMTWMTQHSKLQIFV